MLFGRPFPAPLALALVHRGTLRMSNAKCPKQLATYRAQLVFFTAKERAEYEESRRVQLAIFAMVVFGGVETAFADIQYSFTTIDFPGAQLFGTTANGINDSGQIVGSFNAATGGHGFLATPASVPEPPSSFTLATGLVALSAIAWRRAKTRQRRESPAKLTSNTRGDRPASAWL